MRVVMTEEEEFNQAHAEWLERRAFGPFAWWHRMDNVQKRMFIRSHIAGVCLGIAIGAGMWLIAWWIA